MPEEDIWALIYYVNSLVEQRDTAEGRALRAQLLAQPEFVPPADNPEGDTGEADTTDGDAGEAVTTDGDADGKDTTTDGSDGE